MSVNFCCPTTDSETIDSSVIETDYLCRSVVVEMLDVKLHSSEDHVGRPAPITNFPMLLTTGIFENRLNSSNHFILHM